MRRVVLGAGVLCTAAATVPLATAGPLRGQARAGGDHKVTLCHATSSQRNPYVHISVDLHSWEDNPRLRGHFHHEDDFVDLDGDCVRDDDQPTAGECADMSLYDPQPVDHVGILPMAFGTTYTLEFYDSTQAGNGVTDLAVAELSDGSGAVVVATGEEVGDTGEFVIPINGTGGVCSSDSFVITCDDGTDAFSVGDQEPLMFSVPSDPFDAACSIATMVASA